MQQSQDIGNVRCELLLKALLAQRTEIRLPRQAENTRCRREVLDEKQARAQARNKAIEHLKVAA